MFTIFVLEYFFNLLVLCEFHIIHPNPTYLRIPLYLPSALATSPSE